MYNGVAEAEGYSGAWIVNGLAKGMLTADSAFSREMSNRHEIASCWEPRIHECRRPCVRGLELLSKLSLYATKSRDRASLCVNRGQGAADWFHVRGFHFGVVAGTSPTFPLSFSSHLQCLNRPSIVASCISVFSSKAQRMRLSCTLCNRQL